MEEQLSKYCRFCDESCEAQEKERGKRFCWRKVPVSKFGTTKEVECVAVYCAYCGRTITVIPSHLFFPDYPNEEKY